MTTKYPKLWDGPNPVGEAKVRALQQVDAPFLRASGMGFASGKMNGFQEVRGGEPGYYLMSNVAYRNVGSPILSIVGGASNPQYKVHRDSSFLVSPLLASWDIGAPCLLHVGGGWVLGLAASEAGEIDPNLTYYFWPVLRKCAFGRRVGVTTSSAEAGKTPARVIHLYGNDPFPAGGSANTFMSTHDGFRQDATLSIWRAGYNEQTERYEFGVKVYSHAELGSWRAPGNTWRYVRLYVSPNARRYNDYLGTEVMGVPQYSNEYNWPSPIFCTGKQRLDTITVARDSNPTGVSFSEDGPSASFIEDPLVPMISTSNDGGRSWSSITAPFLDDMLDYDPFLANVPYLNDSDPPAFLPLHQTRIVGDISRPVRVSTQEAMMAKASVFINVGQDTTLLIATNGDSWRLFRRAGLGGWSPVPWPADSYEIGSGPHIINSALAHPAERCFGEGCAFAPVRFGTDGSGTHHVLYTHDFGNTWTLSPALPSAVGYYPVCVEPYVSPDKPGVLYFTYPSNTDDSNEEKQGVHGYKCDGTFQSFEYVGRLISITGDTDINTSLDYGYLTIYTGDYDRSPIGKRRRPWLSAALPGEYDKDVS